MAPPETAHQSGTFATQRTDNWWVYPLSLGTAMAIFVIYSMWRVFEMGHDVTVVHGAYHYQSPFVAINLSGIMPAALVASAPYLAYPGLILLPFPAGFRFTCYYFRRAYYRSFVARPAGCSVEAWKGKEYKGEKRLMIFQNFHRYFLYATLLLWGMHLIGWILDIFHGGHVYVGIGTVLLGIDIVLLGGYVFGCHALRHLVGGRLDCYSCTSMHQGQHGVWSGVSKLNAKHGFFAISSMFSIMIADFYLRYIDMNGITTILGLPA